MWCSRRGLSILARPANRRRPIPSPRRKLSTPSRTALPPPRYFDKNRHVWLRQLRPGLARLGLTRRALEECGSIDRVTKTSSLPNGTDGYAAGTPLMEIEWSAFEISAADELYHTAWENVEGSFAVACSVPFAEARFNEEAIREACRYEAQRFEEDTWLAEITLREGCELSEGGALCGAVEYESSLARLGRAMFAEDVDDEERR